MNFISVHMIDAFMILVIKENPTNIYIGLFHSGLEGLNFHWVLDVYYMFVGVL